MNWGGYSHVPPVGGPEQDTLKRLCLSAGLGMLSVPPDELEEVAGVQNLGISA